MERSFRFYALILAVSICGCTQKAPPSPPPPPPPPPPPQALHEHSHPVTLDVQSGSSTQSGYVDTHGSNGDVYSCKYTGGDDGAGNLTIDSTEGHNVTIPINLHGGGNFTIGVVYFPKDPNGQLSADTKTNRRNAVIKDKNDMLQDGTYKVIVQDTLSSGDVVILSCDPGIRNK